MKKQYFLIFLIFIITCSTITVAQNKIPKDIVISGKIFNSDSLKEEIVFSIAFPGRSCEMVRAEVDSSGNFSVSFESYTPTDILVEYKASFYTLVYPGDSLFISFNGDLIDTPELLKTINYSGNAAKLNQEVALFQQLYYSNAIIHNQTAHQIAVKELNPEDYLKYLNMIKHEARKVLNTFKASFAPEHDAILWASTIVESEYYFALAAYPSYHRYLNKFGISDWDVPLSYYDSLLNFFPISPSVLICGNIVAGIINTFHYDYVRLHIFNEPEYIECVSEHFASPNFKQIKDSLVIQGVVKFTPDVLSRQLVLTEMIQQSFDENEIGLFKKNRKVFEALITEPFLIEPVIERYNRIEERLTNPKLFSEEVFRKAKKSSVNHIIDSILTFNKRKVIYINFWATWCSPCLGEFPTMKTLIKQMENEDVSFIFICLDSNEKVWKKIYDELNIGGKHYYLSERQSNDMYDIFEFIGVPYHVLIDKSGTIIENGAHLTGNVAKKEIELLLKNK